FPVDEQTIKYLQLTGRDAGLVDLVERYAKEQGLWRQKDVEPEFTQTLELDLSTVTPSVAGPRRPQDRVELRSVKQSFRSTLTDVFKKAPEKVEGPHARFDADAPSAGTEQAATATAVDYDKLTHGDVVIAAITSCTNTSNP